MYSLSKQVLISNDEDPIALSIMYSPSEGYAAVQATLSEGYGEVSRQICFQITDSLLAEKLVAGLRDAWNSALRSDLGSDASGVDP